MQAPPGFNSFAAIMPMDTKETKESYEVSIDIPGVDKNDIHVDIENDCLVIMAEKKRETKEEDAQFKRIERVSGTMTRSIALPDHINEDNIEAGYENGVLHLKIPKVYFLFS